MSNLNYYFVLTIATLLRITKFRFFFGRESKDIHAPTKERGIMIFTVVDDDVCDSLGFWRQPYMRTQMIDSDQCEIIVNTLMMAAPPVLLERMRNLAIERVTRHRKTDQYSQDIMTQIDHIITEGVSPRSCTDQELVEVIVWLHDNMWHRPLRHFLFDKVEQLLNYAPYDKATLPENYISKADLNRMNNDE